MQVLDATVAVIAQHISHLHKLIDNIALLDMLCSLATVVSRSSEPYVIPQCTQTGQTTSQMKLALGPAIGLPLEVVRVVDSEPI